MKTTILLLCAAGLSSFTLVSCQTGPPDDFQDNSSPPPMQVRHYQPETPKQEAPEDFRAVTPPSSYSR